MHLLDLELDQIATMSPKTVEVVQQALTPLLEFGQPKIHNKPFSRNHVKHMYIGKFLDEPLIKEKNPKII
jgi:hypothetical protein